MKISTCLLNVMMLLAVACKKNVSDPPGSGGNPPGTDSTKQVINAVPFPQSAVTSCTFSPDYGDSIFYPQPSSSDYYISPVNNQGIDGKYFSWPQGLSINAGTGSIDVTRSVSGLRYSVGFVKTGTTDTCLSNIIVGGASYADSVYSMASSDTTAPPYFDGNPYGPNICSAKGPNDGNKCAFDIYNNAKFQGIVIDKKTGFVDLKKTMKQINNNYAILFDGETLLTTFYYKINDNSNNAVQQMQLELVYYSSKSKIPADVLAEVDAKNTNIYSGVIIATGVNPKPPLIIIVRN